MNLDLFNPLREERGVTLIMVALLILVFIGVAALAIDIGHLFVVRNELQNAADAGCLSGARFLYSYSDDGMVVKMAVNENANQIAYQAAVANKSEKAPVEVLWSGGDVERGHWCFWCFETPTFTPNESPQPVDLWDVSPEELDANLDFINAIRVKTRRQKTPVASFFAGIFGYENFSLSTEAIAYIGFAGTLAPGEVDQPIAICKESLLVDEKYTCTIGRVISIGTHLPGQQTGGWTDFTQDPLGSVPNPLTVALLVTQNKNPDPIILGLPLAVSGGDMPVAFSLLRDRWEDVTDKDESWRITLPVVECPNKTMVGAVTVNIVWITGEVEDPAYSDAPWVMEDPRDQTTWSSNDPDGQVRWNSFVQNFNLQKMDGSSAPYQEKVVYFLPDCNYHKPAGRTGGENFGVLAKIPVLAK